MSVARSGRTALASVAVMFAANGLTLGAYAASLPTLRERLALDHLQIPLVLLVVGSFGILGMQLGGRAIERFGVRAVALAGFPGLVLGAIAFGVSPTYPVALTGGALIGVGNGLLDVAMNAFAVHLEQGRSSAVMSRLHALWSLGNFAGAGLVLVVGRLVGLDLLMPIALGIAAGATLITGGALARWCPYAAPDPPRTRRGSGGRIPPIAWLLGAMAIAFGLAEGTAYDWSSIHITDVAGVDPGIGALGLTATAAAMVAIRLMGDWLVDRFGRRAVVRFGGACAGVGYAVVALTSALPVLLGGWALIGFGVGMIAPQVYAVAGHTGGPRGLALVVTFGYATFLSGPAVMGALIAGVGIQPAMFAPGLMCLGLIALAQGMPEPDRVAP
ncbi:MAG: MFS transporter [Propionibacteriaceae bacterium]|nr:MFS transporter [Propionibacteriaceae bacterium]